MPKTLKGFCRYSLLLAVLSFTSIFTQANQANSTLNYYHKFLSISESSLLSDQEKIEQFETLVFSVNENNHPRIVALSQLRLMSLHSKSNDSRAFHHWQDALSQLTFSEEETSVVHFLVSLYQMEINRNEGQHSIAISQGISLKNQLANFTFQYEHNLVNGILQLRLLDKAQLLSSLGNSYYETLNFEEAQKLFIEAITIYEHLESPKGRLAALNQLSMINWSQKNYSNAIDLTRDALTISDELNDKESYLRGQTNLGIYHAAMSNFDNALASYNKVLQHPKINQFLEIKVQCLIAKAGVLQEINEYKVSEQTIQEALLISTSTNDIVSLSNAKVVFAKILKKQQKYDQALIFYLEAMASFEELKLQQQQINILKNLSDLYRDLGDFNNAYKYLRQYNKDSIGLLEKTQQTSVNNLHEKYRAQEREQQIKLLQQENLINNNNLDHSHQQRELTLVLSVFIVLFIVFYLYRYFNKRDIKRLIQHNKNIDASEKQLLLLSHAFSNTGDAMWITNTDFEIEAVNNAFVLTSHKTRMEVLGKKVSFSHINGQDDNFTKRILLQTQKEGSWHGELYEQRSEDEIYPLELSIESILDEQESVIHYLGVFRDITERKKYQEKLTQAITHDELTGLPNRALLEQHIRQSCLRAKYSMKTPTLLLFNVNGFKKINDSLGHTAGDSVITEIAQRLKAKLFSKDVIARITGAEFCILVELNEPKRCAARVAQKILSVFERPFTQPNTSLNITASLGITLYPDDSDNAQDLLRKAAIAMLDVKQTDSHHYRFFETRMNEEVVVQIEQEQKLLNAINNQCFEFYYQPIVSTASGAITGAEALIRWIEPNGNTIPPSQFIPLAEKAGFIDQIDRIAINRVFEQAANWQLNNRVFGAVSINVSAKMFSKRFEFINLLQAKLSQFKIAPCLIKIEITEGVLLSNIDQAIETMEQIKALGFKLALDDFGTGFSSLNYLKKFPIDFLKIDRSFITGMHTSIVDQNIVGSIISLAHTLGIKVVGEGVELKEHLVELQKMNCEEYQGYLYSKPLPIKSFEALLSDHNKGIN